jgi:hypothetical protein
MWGLCAGKLAENDSVLAAGEENAIDGALLGLLYLRGRPALATPIIAHGVTDTVDFLLLFLGFYPSV